VTGPLQGAVLLSLECALLLRAELIEEPGQRLGVREERISSRFLLRSGVGGVSGLNMLVSWFRARWKGPMLMQALAVGLISLVGVVFLVNYPAGLLLWRYYSVIGVLVSLVAVNLLLMYPFSGTKPHPLSWLDWPLLVLSAVLVLAAVWMSSQPPIVYLLSIVCGQVTFRRGVWPAGVAFGAANLVAWVMLQIAMGASFYTIFGTEAALAAGILFVVLLTSLLKRYSLQTQRAENLLAELQLAGREIEAAHRREKDLAVAEERLRLSRDLHDSVTQELYSVMMYAEAAVELLSSGETQGAVGHVRALRDTAQQALQEMRMLVFDLHRPTLEQGGLARALQSRLDAVEGRSGIRVEVDVAGREELRPAVEKELYNIAREALNNVLKHARAKQVRVLLRFAGDGAEIEVADDGVGFLPAGGGAGGGLGIPGMRERADRIGATLRIETVPGKGTTVAVQVPRSRPEHPQRGGTEQ
jgi:signal transduction histidine kinase